MGYMRHHSIVLNASYGDDLDKAHAKATSLGMMASDIVASKTNGVRSFFIAPDGSKEGWDESERGDTQRQALRDWLDTQRYEDGSGPIAWAEMQYGDDEHETLIVNHSDEPSRRVPGTLI